VIHEVRGHNSLDISDILGSNSGSLHKTMFIPNPSKYHSLNCNDIEGATSGSRGKLRRNQNMGQVLDN